MASTVVVRILGPLELVVDGTPRRLAGVRQRAVLALLALNRGLALSIDRIVDDLWGERAPATARKTVQVYVSQLRRALGEASWLLATDDGGYRLSAAVATDADEFERFLAEARELAAQGRAGEASARYGTALAMWRGDPLADFAYDAFAREEIARLGERRLVATESLIEAELACGRHVEMVAELEALVGAHPLRERLRGQLMLALYRSGRQGEALQVYQDGRRVLAHELGIDPGAALRRLHQAVLDQDVELDRPVTAATGDAATRPGWRRRGRVAGGAVLIAAALMAAVIQLTGGGGSAALGSVAGDAVGVIDPASAAIVGQVAVGQTPTVAAVTRGAVYVLNADAGTVSRIDPGSFAVETKAPGGTPAGVAVGGGAVWVSYASRSPAGHVRVQQLDADTLDPVGGSVRLPATGPSQGDVPIVYASRAVWVVDQAGGLDRIDPRTRRVELMATGVTPPLAAGAGAVWATTYRHGINLERVDLQSGRIRRFPVPLVSIESLAVGAGGVWATDSFTGTVWRVQATAPPLVQSVRVGLSAGAVAVGARSVWVASALDGTVSKVDPRRMRVVDTARVGNAPQGLAYGDGRVWVTVAAGGGRALSGPTIAGAGGGIGALPEAVCGPVIHAGSKPPQRLIAADLPLDQVDATVTLPMAQAIEFVLRQRHFRAGAYRIGLQVCDDSTAQAQAWTPGKCQADAKLFATTPTVIGVIGPYNSGCAEQEIPITNRAGLAMVSPTNSYIGLTRAGPGAAPGDPGRLYPTSTRTYFRVYPPDNAEAAAEALLAHQLGLRRIFVVRDPDPYYGAAVAGGFARTAPKVGVQPVGATQWQPSQLASPSRATAANRVHAHALAELIRQSHADGVVLAGVASSYPNAVLTRLRQSLGPRIVFIADDAFLTQRVAPVVPNLTNFYICAASITDPTHQLPAAGRRFLNAFRATQPGRAADIYSPFAAQAAEVLLEAIAHSNATRASVLQELATTNVRDGILGRFGFDRNGDIDRDRIGIYRATGSTLKLDRTITVPSQLLGG